MEQNRAYLPHFITDPHSHPILLLQKLLNISIPYTEFNKLLESQKYKKLKTKPKILVVHNLPYNLITNQLIEKINLLEFPIVLKTSDYHTFVVNKNFLKILSKIHKNMNFNNYIWKEQNFSLVDKIVIDLLIEDSQKNYELLSNEFFKNFINKTIDAFTTKYFYKFYNSINIKDLEIRFLVDSKFFIDLPSIIEDERVLGIKFFIDGSMVSNTAWINSSYNCFFNEKEFQEIIRLIINNFINSKNSNFYKKFFRFYLAFHSVGNLAFNYFVKKILKETLFDKFFSKFDYLREKILLRVEHCSLVLKEDLIDLIEFIRENGLERKIFLVLNPEETNFKLVDLYRFREYFYVCYASDAPIFNLNLKESIYKFIGLENNKYLSNIVYSIFKFNELLFE